MLGDSITDGVGATAGADRRWPDLLARRLGGRWGVANEGISGNRLLNDGIGANALARLDRDVLALPGIDTMILLEGVNDLGLSFGHITGPLAEMIHQRPQDRITADDIIAAYRQIIARAHARGIRVIGATILPYKGVLLLVAGRGGGAAGDQPLHPQPPARSTGSWISTPRSATPPIPPRSAKASIRATISTAATKAIG